MRKQLKQFCVVAKYAHIAHLVQVATCQVNEILSSICQDTGELALASMSHSLEPIVEGAVYGVYSRGYTVHCRL